MIIDLHFPPTSSTPIMHLAVFMPKEPNAMIHRKNTHIGYDVENEAPNPPTFVIYVKIPNYYISCTIINHNILIYLQHLWELYIPMRIDRKMNIAFFLP